MYSQRVVVVPRQTRQVKTGTLPTKPSISKKKTKTATSKIWIVLAIIALILLAAAVITIPIVLVVTRNTGTFSNPNSSPSTTSSNSGGPTCLTCMVSYVNASTNTDTCEAACRTTNYYGGNARRFPSNDSSCTGVVSPFPGSTFCATSVNGYYLLTNNTDYFFGFEYDNYSNTIYHSRTHILYSYYLAPCVNYQALYCCCA